MSNEIRIPNLAVVVLIGASGSGKSTFAKKNFKPTEILSSDACRGLVSDDDNDQAATGDAFEVLHFIASKRLAAGKMVVVDATNVQAEARRPLVELARAYHCLPVAIVLDVPERVCQDRKSSRPDRAFGPHVVRNHVRSLRNSLRGLGREGFRHVFVLKDEQRIADAAIVREPLWNDKRSEHGPFDIVGDIHGCYDELVALLEKLGYRIETELTPAAGLDSDASDSVRAAPSADARANKRGEPPTMPPTAEEPAQARVTPPEGRRAIFLGDLVDRGPRTPAVLRLVMDMAAAGTALCVPGNHDIKLMRKLSGKDVQITHGLGETLAQLEGEPPAFIRAVREFLDGLVSHYVLDDGALVVAHAGMKESMQGRGSGAVREFALFGETTGETDEFGLPVRYNWAEEYRGRAMVVYGHTPVPVAEWLNDTINIDTGCVFGGRLTALRYPERELVSVASAAVYSQPARPFLPESDEPRMTHQQLVDDTLDIADVIGKRLIGTRLHGKVTIREENANAALEVMSRFAADPKWLIYLPPTMSPSETTSEPGLLEHPSEAFAYYRNQGIPTVLCEEKHMGSRVDVVVCRDESVALARFGVREAGIGVAVTRTGRKFFAEDALEAQFLKHIVGACDRSGLWEELETDWLCLDCELMPWSAKAQELLKQQYAAVGSAATGALTAACGLLGQASARLPEAGDLLERFTIRKDCATAFVDAYRRYCWPVSSLSDLRLAPFHIMASEGRCDAARDHVWHMTTLSRLAAAGDGLIVATPYRQVDVTDPESVAGGARWWEELTGSGGEGMVVKPLDFIASGTRGLAQPAVKCRGKEYLRIIYGPEYAEPENLPRLRSRGLGGKRSLALREFALGIEALERFVRREPLRRVHECVFGVLALESEPVDPRL